MAPAQSFAALIAECLRGRQAVVVYTVVRTAMPARFPAGAKVVCPVGAAPRSFSLEPAAAQLLIDQLPLTDADFETRLIDVAMGEAGDLPLTVYGDLIRPALQLIVAGAGHIAQPLAAVGHALGWSVVVTDDRADYADAKRFPVGVEVVCAPFDAVWPTLTIDGATAIALVTRGHEHDEQCLRALAAMRPFYVGMIGSKRRVHTVIKRLRADGLPDKFLERVYAPVGLPIGTETPAEIALAITAEVVAVWRGRGDWARDEKQRYYYGK